MMSEVLGRGADLTRSPAPRSPFWVLPRTRASPASEKLRARQRLCGFVLGGRSEKPAQLDTDTARRRGARLAARSAAGSCRGSRLLIFAAYFDRDVQLKFECRELLTSEIHEIRLALLRYAQQGAASRGTQWV